MHVLAGGVCSAVAVLLYVNGLGCGFCFDDREAVLGNADILATTPWVSLLRNDFWGTPVHLDASHKSYRPLCVATFRLNYMLHGLHPMGYHLVNVLLHAVVCYLYVQLCALVFTQVWPAFLAGLLFAAHPVHTEVVTAVVGRADLLCAVFYLLCILSYHHYLTRPPKSGHSKRKGDGLHMLVDACCPHLLLVLSILCAVCSILCKELGFTVIAVCLLYDFLLHKSVFSLLLLRKVSRAHVGGIVRRCAILFACAAAMLLMRIGVMKSMPKFSKVDNEALTLNFPYRQLHWAYLVTVNAWLLLNPSHLIHDYRMKIIPLITSAGDPRHLLTLTTLATLLLLFTLALRKRGTPNTTCSTSRADRIESDTDLSDTDMPPMRLPPHSIQLFGLLLCTISFLPASNLFFPVGFVVAERVLYLPSMGFCMLISQAACKLVSCHHKLLSHCVKAGLLWLLLVHSVKTVSRNADWTTPTTLHASVLKLHPTNGPVLANIAREFRGQGDLKTAELVYRHAMKVAPKFPNSFVNFGSMLSSLGRFKESEEVLHRAIPLLLLEGGARHRETLASVYTTLCNMMARDQERLEEATSYCEAAVNTSESSFNAHNSLGAVLMHRGDNTQAIQAFKRAVALNGTNAIAEFNLALAYLSTGQQELAVQSLQRVLEADTDHKSARNHLEELRRKNIL